MDDLISRQAARRIIEDINTFVSGWWYSALEQIDELPTAEKKGEWIPVVDGHYITWECSECHVESDAWTDFCPICGSRNIEETDEEAYEEALEKFLQNPKTYTLDEVEAELGLTEDPNDKAAFEAGYTKAQMELKDAYKPKKGKWVEFANEDGELDLKCSVCGEEQGFYFGYFNFCPNCGADMREEGE